MSLIKRSAWPLQGNGSWLSNFFDTEKFFDSDWVKDLSIPAVNVKEAEKSYEVELAAPGLSKKDFKITAVEGILTISSEKEEEKEEKGKSYTRKEFGYNAFSRSFTLPENANEEDIKASYEGGILKLSIAKKAVSQPKANKAIEVK